MKFLLDNESLSFETLRRLSPEHRQVLLECHCRHSSVAEAAARLGVSAETVKSRIHYALRAIRLTLEELEAASSAATHPRAGKAPVTAAVDARHVEFTDANQHRRFLHWMNPTSNRRRYMMSTITTKDGARIFYKDWGSGRPVVFSHGWPLNADAWDPQANLVASNGYRAVVHDRRGHGRSTQTWGGNDMDSYADDLAALMDELDLSDAVLVGHSTGGGEVVRYLARHGTSRVAKAVLLGAVPPLMLKTDANPEGTPIEAFDAIRAGVASDRSAFYKDLSAAFYGFNRPGAKVSEGKRNEFWLQGMQVGFKGAYDCVKAFSETDFTDDLPKIDIPVLVAHGDDDQIVPIQAAALKTVKLLPNATLKVYSGAPHGLNGDYEREFNTDLLAFLAG
ncbi:MAG: non-heme chloroperoxidase [Pseudonocardiales bacterium]|nr:non-heme chloroperoxidase [Pseudonocardiales bacterium]